MTNAKRFVQIILFTLIVVTLSAIVLFNKKLITSCPKPTSVYGSKELRGKGMNLCPETPPNLKGKVRIVKNDDFFPPPWQNLNSMMTAKQEPLNCIPRRNVAVIIPYRDRDAHLRSFLFHMHPVFRRQQLNFTIFVIEQNGTEHFNRAKLLNAGFVEAQKAGKFDCFFFHDVDILLQDDRCLYCGDTGTRHFATMMDKFEYIPIDYVFGFCPADKDEREIREIKYFGGVTRVNPQDMVTVNGYSNEYWAWGAEDDDFYIRFKDNGLDPDLGRENCLFTMAKHSQAFMAPSRSFLLRHTTSRSKYDGLNTLKYEVVSHDVYQLYTKITVEIGHPHPLLTDHDKISGMFDSPCTEVTEWLAKNIFHFTPKFQSKSKNKIDSKDDFNPKEDAVKSKIDNLTEKLQPVTLNDASERNTNEEKDVQSIIRENSISRLNKINKPTIEVSQNKSARSIEANSTIEYNQGEMSNDDDTAINEHKIDFLLQGNKTIVPEKLILTKSGNATSTVAKVINKITNSKTILHNINQPA